MFDDPATIYAARTLQDAYLLKNLLAEEQIEAVVVNEALQGGSGVDIVGWPTLARVVVAEHDAERARQIAVDFDQNLAAAARSPTAEPPPPSPAPATPWPGCPQCGRRRITRCPACGTAGTDFPPADTAPAAIDVLDPQSASGAACVGCGPGGCSPARTEGEESDSALERQTSEASAPMLMCPTCDEPFVPEYARRCEWCGHEFADGYEGYEDGAATAEPMNMRIAAVVVGLIVFVVAILVYLLFIF